MIYQGKNRKPPAGSVGSRITGKRRVGEKRIDTPQLVSVRSRGLTRRDERRRENRAVAILVWLCVILFLVLSGTLLTYQAYAFLAGDKVDVEVPEVVGMTFDNAAPVVEAAGLVLRIRMEEYESDPEGGMDLINYNSFRVAYVAGQASETYPGLATRHTFHGFVVEPFIAYTDYSNGFDQQLSPVHKYFGHTGVRRFYFSDLD